MKKSDELPPISEIPFSLGDLHRAIPRKCFEPKIWKSLGYLIRDICVVSGLFFLALYFNSWFFWPVYWFLQGTMFWAIFVIGHDCGHGTFSKKPRLNHFFGQLTHSFILVPYHGWRISHRTHHLNTGHIDNEEVWQPFSKSEYEKLPLRIKIIRFHLFVFSFISYLFFRSTKKDGSHFLPSSPLFQPQEKKQVITSSICCALVLAFLIILSFFTSWGLIAKLYWGPYLGFIIYIDIVTFLHHTSPELPWYRENSWDFLRGNLSAIDYDYGFIEPIHHNIGTHIVHHLFMNIPHYHLKEATEAIKPILGIYYRKSKISILKAIKIAWQRCHFVPDEGSVVYYEAKPKK